MAKRIVITGLGIVCALGESVDSFWQSLVNGRSAIRSLPDNIRTTKIRIGAMASTFEGASYFDHDELILLDRFSQFAVVAARQAIEDAAMGCHNDHMERVAAVIGSGCGGKYTDEDTYVRLYKEGRARVHPMTIPKGMPSAAASMVGSYLGIKGPTFSVASACASAAHAVAQGCMLIRCGLADAVIVGGADAPFTHGLLKSWEALRVVSNDTCRPFSKNRTGMVLGEGAAVLMIESEQHAARRGARVYAELAGVGMSSDAGHITRPDLNGVSNAIICAMKDSGLSPRDIDYVNAHGTATDANDIVETQALHQAFGPHAASLAVSSTKSMHGHALGASSALELVATVLAVYHGIIPPTVNFTEPGAGCDLDYVPNEARTCIVNAALSNAFAFGGLNAVVAVKAWNK